MKSINEIYKKLKNNYPNYDITIVNNEIIVKVDKYQIKGDTDIISLDKDGVAVTHFHCSDINKNEDFYNEMYDIFVYYIEKRSTIGKQIKKEQIILCLIIFLIGGILYCIFK